MLGINYYAKGYQTVPKKTPKEIINLELPKDKKQVSQFLGMVKYYRDLCPNRSDILAPLTELNKGVPTKNVPIKWNPYCTEEFQQMKAIIAK